MSNRSAYGGRRLSLKEMARRDLIPREEGADGGRRGGTRISAQSFSAGNAAWKGRVGEDRSAPNSFGSNFTSMRDMWAGRFLNSSGSLRDRWGRNGFINNAAERQASYGRRVGLSPAGQPQTPAAGLKGDDFLGKPGIKAPVRAGVPGARSFDYGGAGIYTWSADQEEADLDAPAGSVARGALGYDPSISGEDYGALAQEAGAVGAGNGALMSSAGRASAALTRTGEPVTVQSGPPAASVAPSMDLWTELGGLSLARSGTDPQAPLKKLLDELTGGRSAAV